MIWLTVLLFCAGLRWCFYSLSAFSGWNFRTQRQQVDQGKEERLMLFSCESYLNVLPRLAVFLFACFSVQMVCALFQFMKSYRIIYLNILVSYGVCVLLSGKICSKTTLLDWSCIQLFILFSLPDFFPPSLLASMFNSVPLWDGTISILLHCILQC